MREDMLNKQELKEKKLIAGQARAGVEDEVGKEKLPA
jgi:hypothetical protein